MIFELLPVLCTPHIQLSVTSNTDSTTKTREVFQCLTKTSAYCIADIVYPFKHEVTNCTLDGVSIHPVTTKIQSSFLTMLPERKETAQGFHHEANGDFKTVTIVAVLGEN